MEGRVVLDTGWGPVELDHVPMGPAADGSVQVGAYRTFRSSPTRTWNLVASLGGAAAWLGAAPDPWWHGEHDGPVAGDVLEALGGERYEVRGAMPGSRIRLRSLGPLQLPSTLELTLVAAEGRTTVALHQEGLLDPAMCEPMREHWKRALERIGDLLGA